MRTEKSKIGTKDIIDKKHGQLKYKLQTFAKGTRDTIKRNYTFEMETKDK